MCAHKASFIDGLYRVHVCAPLRNQSGLTGFCDSLGRAPLVQEIARQVQ